MSKCLDSGILGPCSNNVLPVFGSVCVCHQDASTKTDLDSELLLLQRYASMHSCTDKRVFPENDVSSRLLLSSVVRLLGREDEEDEDMRRYGMVNVLLVVVV